LTAERKTILVAGMILILLAGCSGPRPEAASTATQAVVLPPTVTMTPAGTSIPLTVTLETTTPYKSFGPLSQGADYVQAAKMFDEKQALKHVEYLANDALEGRRAGTPGGRQAGEYIAARFSEYGLQPAGSGGSYFQPFSAPSNNIVTSPILTVIFPSLDVSSNGTIERAYAYHTDYLPRIPGYMGSGEATGQVVWLGGCDSGDLNTSMSNKIILCRPAAATRYYDLVSQSLTYKIGGLLLIREDKGPYPRPGYGVGEMSTLPAFGITRSIARDLLAGTQYMLDNLDQLPVPTPLATTVHMAASFQSSEIEARNVLGMLPGTDPQYKDEIIVVGAHYDHVGRDPDGTIYNGANDNAAAVAVMLEIARLWHAQGFRPARSVLFAAWDAEELGIVGSRYYVSHPVSPLDHTKAMLNLDMDGMGEKLYIAGSGPMAVQLQASAKFYDFATTLDPEPGGSDHESFHEAGITASNLAIYPDSVLDLAYHRPEDDIQNVMPASLRVVGILSIHTLAAWSGGEPTLPPS
jgi:Peptidase family M28